MFSYSVTYIISFWLEMVIIAAAQFIIKNQTILIYYIKNQLMSYVVRQQGVAETEDQNKLAETLSAPALYSTRLNTNV